MEAEDIADEAAAAEIAAVEAAEKAAEQAKKATDETSRRAAEEAEKKALAEAMANKEKRLRANLKASVKSRKTEKLEPAILEAKAAKMAGTLIILCWNLILHEGVSNSFKKILHLFGSQSKNTPYK